MLRTRQRGNHNSKICIAIAAPTISELHSKAIAARKYNPGFIELRVDYLKEDLSNPRNRDRISRLFDGREILTLRSKSEGGKFKGTERESVELIKEFVYQFHPRYVDVELSTLSQEKDLLLTLEDNSRRTKVIGSVHFFDRTPSQTALERLVSRSNDSLFALKIACSAKTFKDNFKVLSLYNIQRSQKLIAFCMGPFGMFSRIACIMLGSPLTYASLPEEQIASGQLDALTMNQLLSKL